MAVRLLETDFRAYVIKNAYHVYEPAYHVYEPVLTKYENGLVESAKKVEEPILDEHAKMKKALREDIEAVNTKEPYYVDLLKDNEMWETSEDVPRRMSPFSHTDTEIKYLFKNRLYGITGNDQSHTHEELQFLVMDKYDSDRRKFERLKHKFGGRGETRHERPRVPEQVRIQVWRRDDGKCSRCGSRENLEYDHIIPVSEGGSNTVRNIELLCETCNRKKSNNIQ